MSGSLQKIVLDYQAEGTNFSFGSDTAASTVTFKGAGSNLASVIIEGNLDVRGTQVIHNEETVRSDAIITGSLKVGDGLGSDYIYLYYGGDFVTYSDNGTNPSNRTFSLDGATGGINSSGYLSIVGPISITASSGQVLTTASGTLVNFGGSLQVNGDTTLGTSGGSNLINLNGKFSSSILFSQDNSYDIGASTASRARSIYAATAFIVGNTHLTDGLLTRSGDMVFNLSGNKFIVGSDNSSNNESYLYGDVTIGSPTHNHQLIVNGASFLYGNITLGRTPQSAITFTGVVSSNILFITDNFYNIGAESDNRPKHVYVYDSVIIADYLEMARDSIISDGRLYLSANAGELKLKASDRVVIGDDSIVNDRVYIYGDTVIGSDAINRNLNVKGTSTLEGNTSIIGSATFRVNSGKSTFGGQAEFQQLVKVVGTTLNLNGSTFLVDDGALTPNTLFKVDTLGVVEAYGPIKAYGGLVTNSTGSLNITTTNIGNDLNLSSALGSLSLKDRWLTSPLSLSQNGTTGLVGFVSTSIIGALNELKTSLGGAWKFNIRLSRDTGTPGVLKYTLPSVPTQSRFVSGKIMVFVNGQCQMPGTGPNDAYQEEVGNAAVIFSGSTLPAIVDDVFATYIEQ